VNIRLREGFTQQMKAESLLDTRSHDNDLEYMERVDERLLEMRRKAQEIKHTLLRLQTEPQESERLKIYSLIASSLKNLQEKIVKQLESLLLVPDFQAHSNPELGEV
jgi:Mg2+ and Co2+ transporter CorA